MAGVVSVADSKYSNQVSQTASFFRDVVVPGSERFGRVLSKFFKTPVKPDLMKFLSGDLAQAARIVEMVAGLWDRATALKLTGQEPKPEDYGKPYTAMPMRSDMSPDVRRPRSGDEPEDE